MELNDNMKPRTSMAKVAMCRKKAFFHEQTGLNIKDETSKVLQLEHSYIWCWNWSFRKVDQKYLDSLEMWCWRQTEKIISTDFVRKK